MITIQTPSNTNFKARKLLQTKTLNNKVDVYFLTKNDSNFAKRCLDVCESKSRGLKPNNYKIYKEENPLEAFVNFWKNFQNKDNSNDKFLLAIKDDTFITGILECKDNYQNCCKQIDKLLLLQDDSTTKESLLYSVFHLMQKRADEPFMEFLKHWEYHKNKGYKTNANQKGLKQTVISLWADVHSKQTRDDLISLGFIPNVFNKNLRCLPTDFVKMKKLISNRNEEISFKIRYNAKDEFDLSRVLSLDENL